MNKKYTEEQIEWIREAVRTKPATQVVDEFNARYDREMTKEKLKSLRKREKIRAGVPEKTGHESIYSDEEQEFMRNNVEGNTARELAELVNAKFGKNYKETQISSWKKRNHLRSGVDTKFKKGYCVNKGCKVTEETYEKIRGTFFKKGSVPANWTPVGTIRVRMGRTKWIKIAEPGKWKQLSRYLWEQAYGPIPKGHTILHRDGDCLNDTLENLIMVSRKDMAVINTRGLQNYMCDETADQIVAYSQLVRATRQKIKEKRKKRGNKL